MHRLRPVREGLSEKNHPARARKPDHPRPVPVTGPRERGKKNCSVGCIACTLCTKVAGNAIKMEGALAVVDYSQPLENEEAITKCPQHTIIKRSGRKEVPA